MTFAPQTQIVAEICPLPRPLLLLPTDNFEIALLKMSFID
jgi:hypothetical protein